MWNFRLDSLLKVFPHSVQLCGFSPVWTSMWFLRLPFWWKPFPHTSHTKSFSLLCIFMCVFSVDERLKALWQNSHLWGFSAVWMILCLHNVLESLKPLPHTLQTNGLVLVWSGMRWWMVSVYLVLNILWHWLHWYFGCKVDMLSSKESMVPSESVGLGRSIFGMLFCLICPVHLL